jgi:hypothetical protein
MALLRIFKKRAILSPERWDNAEFRKMRHSPNVNVVCETFFALVKSTSCRILALAASVVSTYVE